MSAKTATRELLIEIGCEEMPAGWPVVADPPVRPVYQRPSSMTPDWLGTLPCWRSARRGGWVCASRTSPAGRPTVEEHVTGPPVSAAFDDAGQPTAAALGFARKQGVDVKQLNRVETPKGEYLSYRHTERGATARSVLGGVLAATLRALSFPKQMNWDARIDDGQRRVPIRSADSLDRVPARQLRRAVRHHPRRRRGFRTAWSRSRRAR